MISMPCRNIYTTHCLCFIKMDRYVYAGCIAKYARIIVQYKNYMLQCYLSKEHEHKINANSGKE